MSDLAQAIERFKGGVVMTALFPNLRRDGRRLRGACESLDWRATQVVRQRLIVVRFGH